MMHNEYMLVEVVEQKTALKIVSNNIWKRVKVIEGKLKGKTLIVNNMGLTEFEDNKYFLDERRIYMEEPI